MRHRAGAASLAVIGGLLVVAAVFTPSWWVGPIHIAGRVIHGKTVHISMLRATGCNSGDGTCMGLDVGAAFRAVGILTLLLASATAVSSVGLAIKAWSRAVTATTYARFALIGSAATVIGAAFFIAMLPTRFEEIPVGLSPYGFFAGTAAMALASVLALRRHAPARAAVEPVDVRELLSTDMLRPAMLGPEPKMGRHGAVLSEEPSFTAPSGPRFRPLYEVQAMQAQQQAMQAQQQAMQAQQQGMHGGHAPPPSGMFAPPSGAFAPPPNGNFPPAFAPPSGAFALPPPGGGFAPANGSYPPPSGPYSSPGPSPAHGPHLPAGGGYPPSGPLPPPSGSFAPAGAPHPAAPAHQPAGAGYPPARSSAQHAVASPMDSADLLRAGAMGSASSVAAMAAVDSMSTLAEEDDDAPDSADVVSTANLSPVTDRADALPDATDAVLRVDPPELPAGAAVSTRAASEVDPGFDQPTTPSQMSMAAMLARHAAEAAEASSRQSTELSDDPAGLEEGARRQTSEGYESLDEELAPSSASASATRETIDLTGGGAPGHDSRSDENDSGIFFRKDSAASVGRASISHPPTATTSASLAALAALSKPAVITMAPTVARKAPPLRAGEPAVAAAVAAAVSSPPGPGASPPEPGASTPACPHCEAPMAWAEKHLRYYCATCRMYC